MKNVVTNLSVRVIEFKDGMERRMKWGMYSECQMLAVVEMSDNHDEIFPFCFIGKASDQMYVVSINERAVSEVDGCFPTLKDAFNHAMGSACRYVALQSEMSGRTKNDLGGK